MSQTMQRNVVELRCFKLFQKTSVNSINLSLKYQRFTPSGCKDTGIINLDFTMILIWSVYPGVS